MDIYARIVVIRTMIITTFHGTLIVDNRSNNLVKFVTKCTINSFQMALFVNVVAIV